MARFYRRLLTVIGLLLLGIPAVAQLDNLPNLALFETPDGNFSFYYPAEWTVFNDEAQGLTLMSDEDIVFGEENDSGAYTDDQTLVSIQLFPTIALDVLYGIVGETPAERLDSIAADLSDELEILAPPPADDVLQAIVYQQGDEFIGKLFVWDVNDEITGIAMMLTAPDNFEQADLLTQYILLSMEFNLTLDELAEQYNRGDQ